MHIQVNFTIGARAFREKALGANKKLMYEVGLCACPARKEKQCHRTLVLTGGTAQHTNRKFVSDPFVELSYFIPNLFEYC